MYSLCFVYTTFFTSFLLPPEEECRILVDTHTANVSVVVQRRIPVVQKSVCICVCVFVCGVYVCV